MNTTKKASLLGWILLLGISCVYYFANLQKVLVPAATFNELQRIFNGNAAAVTALGAAFIFAYSLFLFCFACNSHSPQNKPIPSLTALKDSLLPCFRELESNPNAM